MPWVYRITEIKTEANTGGTYVKVHLWRNRGAAQQGDPPHIINEHIMNLKPVRQRAVTDDRGFILKQSGVYASPSAPGDPNDPTVKEDVNVDIRAEIESNIKLFITRAKLTNLPDIDMSDSRFVPTDDDPRGILSRADVQAAKNRNQEFTP